MHSVHMQYDESRLNPSYQSPMRLQPTDRKVDCAMIII